MVQVSRVVDGGEGPFPGGTAPAPLHGYAVPLGLLDTRQGSGEPLGGFHAGQVVDVTPRGRVTVDVQTFHPPGSRLTFLTHYATMPAPRAAPPGI